jgi:signal transduction histidine kinase
MTLGASATRLLAVGTVAFTGLYYGMAGTPTGEVATDLILLFPPALALVLLLRASREEGRARWFWRLLALGPALWLVAEVLWTAAEYLGRAPRLPGVQTHGFPLATDFFFISFLVPMIGAVGLRPHPRPLRRDPVALADTALVLIALSLVFLRVVFLPLRAAEPSSVGRSFVLGALSFVLAAWTAGLWSRVEDPAWRRTYGAVSLFATLYGTLSAAANGMVPAGGVVDAGWFLPFFILAGAATRAPRAATRRVPSAAIVLVAGPGPFLLERILGLILPVRDLGPAFQPQPVLLLVTSVLLAIACAARLLLEERLEQEAQARQRAFSEEGRRAGRLSTLAALSTGLVEDLERATDEVARQARSAAPLLGPKAQRVVEQAERARSIVRDLSASFRVVPPAERRLVDLGRILEDTVASALDEGLPLRLSLAGTAHLPGVVGDPAALGAAFLNVVRNAAQASPGGMLDVSAATDGREVVLRFCDDGPGVPPEIRHRIFDPFFTTRRVGEGVGLGLTQAHFVARDHLGSVVLEPTREGACFVFRLPTRERRAARPVPDAWPLSGAALLSAAVATTLALMAPGPERGAWGLIFQVGAATLAAVALAGAGVAHRGRARLFWGLLAAGPGLWAATRIFRAIEGGAEGAPGQGVWHYVFYAAAELAWVAALVLRPDRTSQGRPSLRALLAAAAALCFFAYFYTYLIVLPWPFTVGDAALDRQTALVRALPRGALAVWGFVLARRAVSPYWRIAFGRLALVFLAWTVGQTTAGYARSLPDYRGGSLADLGWIVPYLLLGAVAITEGRRRFRPERHFTTLRRPIGAAVSLAALAALPAFDALAGASRHPALDAARDELTTFSVVVLGAILALRELLTERGGTTAAGGSSSAAPAGTLVPRLPALVASAVHELGGQLSGIAALARLVLAQSDLPTHVREDARRIRRRGDTGLRIVNNVITALRGENGLPQMVSVNQAVEAVIEERSFDLAEEAIRLSASLSDAVPPLTLNMTALRQAVLCCVDAAAVNLRGTAGGGTIEIVTALDEANADAEYEVLVGVRQDQGGLPRSALRQLGATPLSTRSPASELDSSLGLAREIVSQLHGTLTGHNRPQGGAELWIRLPVRMAAGYPSSSSVAGP